MARKVLVSAAKIASRYSGTLHGYANCGFFSGKEVEVAKELSKSLAAFSAPLGTWEVSRWVDLEYKLFQTSSLLWDFVESLSENPTQAAEHLQGICYRQAQQVYDVAYALADLVDSAACN